MHKPEDLQLAARPRHTITAARQAEVSPVRTIHTGALFGRQREVVIDHHGTQYRLKITRQGKLILNK